MNILTKIKNFFNSSQNTNTPEAQKDLSIRVDPILKDFLENEVLNGLDVDANHFWSAFEDILEEFTPRNKELLQERESIQQQIDKWHIERKGLPIDKEEYKSFLKNIGYITESAANFQITTSNVDPEIAKIAGPQLVVPVMNARFALNAANARWGSLYDALYGTDVIAEDNGAEKVGGYNPVRGDKVIAFAKNFLDEIIPLIDASHMDVVGFTFDNNSLGFKLNNGGITKLNDQSKYIGYADYGNDAFGLLFKNNLLHFEISVDPHHSIGQEDPASIKDIIIESAITTIQDCEDSVAAVDGEDKTIVYRNWLGLMKGDLEETFNKGGSPLTRKLEADRDYIDLEGNNFSLPGRSLMLVRNVGHLMQNPAILDKNGDEVFEGIMDAMFTICIAKHDLMNLGKYSNSRTGSVYIVKPKMHGPKEVEFTCDLFAAVEKALNIKPLSIKVGIMDEERRTTVNLKECIEVAKDRVIFINTGFLDRTGDEIHTSMEAGPMLRKGDIKLHKWIAAYENWNVDTGLETGFKGKAQIGKGMWPMPDEMLGMLQQKTIHPEAGANCAWVPSPTAASIHAIHYHQINVADVQDNLLQRQKASLDDILSIPLLEDVSSLSQEDIQNELDNNTQGILGYVVRWVDQGVGCSKVPDINDIGLMEDRATCRISSQHIANWLYHGICKEDQVIESMKKMAVKVDEQNSGDPLYKNMSPNFDGHAFKAACSLAIDGRVQPSGYTEPILHNMRLKFKSQ